MESEQKIVQGEEALKMAEALTSTILKIMRVLSKERLDVSTIAKRLDLSEAHISEQVRLLEDLGLIKVSYGQAKGELERYVKNQ